MFYALQAIFGITVAVSVGTFINLLWLQSITPTMDTLFPVFELFKTGAM